MQNSFDVVLMEAQIYRPVNETLTWLPRICMGCFVAVFVLSLGMVAASSIGYSIGYITEWRAILEGIVTALVGYLFGANAHK